MMQSNGRHPDTRCNIVKSDFISSLIRPLNVFAPMYMMEVILWSVKMLKYYYSILVI